MSRLEAKTGASPPAELARVAIALWIGLSLIYIPLTRSMQPSLLMTILTIAILMSGSALLLGFGASAMRRRQGTGRFTRVVLVTLVVGAGVALLIRLLYVILEPDIVPFGMAFNILADTIWVGVHALAVGLLLALIARWRFRSIG